MHPHLALSTTKYISTAYSRWELNLRPWGFQDWGGFST